MAAAVLAVVLVGVVAFVSWYRSEDQRRQRLVEDLLAAPGVVSSVDVVRDRIAAVHFSDRASVEEIVDAGQRLDGHGVEEITIGDVDVRRTDLRRTAPVALGLADVEVAPATLRVREVGEDTWVSIGFADGFRGAHARPADGAAAVIAVLDAVREEGLDAVKVVEAHTRGQQGDLVFLVVKQPLRIVPLKDALGRVVARDPAGGVRCDSGGCE